MKMNMLKISLASACLLLAQIGLGSQAYGASADFEAGRASCTAKYNYSKNYTATSKTVADGQLYIPCVDITNPYDGNVGPIIYEVWMPQRADTYTFDVDEKRIKRITPVTPPTTTTPTTPPTTTTPTTPPTTTIPTTESVSSSEMLAAHNLWRGKVGVAGLTWSSTLATYAQEWADTLKSKNCAMQHRSNNKYGENLYWASGGTPTPQSVVGAWASELANYNYATDKCSQVCGHYTQVVWKKTTEVGCAKASCGSAQVWVCNYNPPGNYVGQKPY